jgi:large subunit ribosomal protein L15
VKLHDLQPAPGSRTPRTRVGRGIAAGKGKTAGRGTKGQKARAGGSIPPWFEGGQTPLHMRIPKLRGFKNRFKIQYEVVNVGAIGELAERGAFEVEAPAGKAATSAPITINQDILRAVGLVRTLDKPLKILGAGELTTPLFVVADAFTGSARAKIEAAGGSVNVLEVPSSPMAALGVEPEQAATETEAAETAKPAKGKARAKADAAASDDAATATAGIAEPATAEAQPVTAEPVTAEPVTAEAETAATDNDTSADAPSDDAPAAKAAAKAARKASRAAASAAADAAEAEADAEPAKPAAEAATTDDDEPAAKGAPEPSTGDDA